MPHNTFSGCRGVDEMVNLLDLVVAYNPHRTHTTHHVRMFVQAGLGLPFSHNAESRIACSPACIGELTRGLEASTSYWAAFWCLFPKIGRVDFGELGMDRLIQTLTTHVIRISGSPIDAPSRAEDLAAIQRAMRGGLVDYPECNSEPLGPI